MPDSDCECRINEVRISVGTLFSEKASQILMLPDSKGLTVHSTCMYNYWYFLCLFRLQVLCDVLDKAGYDGRSLIAQAADPAIKDMLKKSTAR